MRTAYECPLCNYKYADDYDQWEEKDKERCDNYGNDKFHHIIQTEKVAVFGCPSCKGVFIEEID